MTGAPQDKNTNSNAAAHRALLLELALQTGSTVTRQRWELLEGEFFCSAVATLLISIDCLGGRWLVFPETIRTGNTGNPAGNVFV